MGSYIDDLKQQINNKEDTSNAETSNNKVVNNQPSASEGMSLEQLMEKPKPKTNTEAPFDKKLEVKEEVKPKEEPKSSFEPLSNLKDTFGSSKSNATSFLDSINKKSEEKVETKEEVKVEATQETKKEDSSDDFAKHIEKQMAASQPTKEIDIKDMNSSKSEVKKEKQDFEVVWDTKAHLVTRYNDAEIYRIDGESLLHYKVPMPKPTPSQKLIINTLKEVATRLITTDPYKIRDPMQRSNIYYQKIMEVLENAPEINIPKHMYDFYAKAVVKEMVGYGMIEPLLQDDNLEEVMIVGPNKPTYVYHKDYGMMTTNVVFYSDDGIQDIIDKIARTLGRRVDISNPLLDARLPDGSRVNATIPPASIDGATVTIRKFKADPYTIVDLINYGTVDLEVAAFLWTIVDGFGAKPANVVISGGTGSGKTTTLNVLANFVPAADRILTIEDTAELKLPVKHIIRFEGRPPGLEGKGELSLDMLVKNTLRMRPDRVIVGEIRHKEALSLFTAMNTGHDGCMGTIHANSARETLVRITSPPMEVPMLMLSGLDFIIVQKRLNTSKGAIRRITSIAEITGVLDNNPQANIIFKWNPSTDKLERTEKPITFFELIKSYTKLSDTDIKNKIEERIHILNDLVNKNTREINQVSQIIQNTYVEEKS